MTIDVKMNAEELDILLTALEFSRMHFSGKAKRTKEALERRLGEAHDILRRNG